MTLTLYHPAFLHYFVPPGAPIMDAKHAAPRAQLQIFAFKICFLVSGKRCSEVKTAVGWALTSLHALTS